MDLTEATLKRRIAALLPARGVDRNGGANGQASGNGVRRENADVSDLLAIPDDEAFLREGYRRILGRECDVSGFVSYLELLQRHTPRRVILLLLINSQECKQRGIRFTGIQESTSKAAKREAVFSAGDTAGRFRAFARDLVRRIFFTRFDSIDHKLNFLLREVTARTDGLANKTDQSLWTLSDKLDAYVANLTEEQRRNQETLTVQSSQIRILSQYLELHQAHLMNVGALAARLSGELAEQRARFEQSTALVGGGLDTVRGNLETLRGNMETLCTETRVSSEQLRGIRLRLHPPAGATDSAIRSAYFYHIPKTAGMSTWQLLHWAYRAEEICPGRMWEDIIEIPKDILAKYKAFRGHFLGYLEPYLGRKFDTFTMLRDPVERSISHYYHARRLLEHPYHAEANSLTLAEFCVHPRTRHMIRNYQSGYLACPCTKDPAALAVGMTPADFAAYKLQLQLDASPDEFPTSEELYNAAAARLKTFAAVGISERLQESLERIARVLGMPDPPPFDRQNVATNRPSGIDSETLRMIQSQTEVDQALYEMVKKELPLE